MPPLHTHTHRLGLTWNHDSNLKVNKSTNDWWYNDTHNCFWTNLVALELKFLSRLLTNFRNVKNARHNHSKYTHRKPIKGKWIWIVTAVHIHRRNTNKCYPDEEIRTQVGRSGRSTSCAIRSVASISVIRMKRLEHKWDDQVGVRPVPYDQLLQNCNETKSAFNPLKYLETRQ
jgi:hypothetical protein